VTDTTVRFEVLAPGGRLDQLLAQLGPEISRSRWQRLIRQGQVRVDGLVVDKASTGLAGGEQVVARVPPPEPSHLVPEPIPLDVIYEDDHLLVVNKPPGMVVHPGAGNRRSTLVQAALAHAPTMRGVGGVRRPGVVHRLDKDTSGVILLAKDDESHQMLQDQFRQRTVKKQYLALVDGHPPTAAGRIEAAIARDQVHRTRMAIVPDEQGRRAVSIYHTLAGTKLHALLNVSPETGRTHQIRVHLAFLGTPVVGDRTYGKPSPSLAAKRQLLHAYSLELLPPGAEGRRTFVAPLPIDFRKALSDLGVDPQTILEDLK
jgi:23S rRNA pseudouridine1911/1915/1917 synthase